MKFSTLHVMGADAQTFLQGQITQNINALLPPEGFSHLTGQGFAALCNLKGRVITTFWIQPKTPDLQHYALHLPSDMLDKVYTHLKRYILRSKVELKTEEISDPDLLSILPPFPYLPWIITQTSELFVPQMLNLDCIQAVSFTKGCYTGQEIVARTHYLGQNKRRMILMNSDLVNPGDEFVIENDNIGTYVAYQEDQALVVTQLRYLDKLTTYLGDKLLKLPYTVAELALPHTQK